MDCFRLLTARNKEMAVVTVKSCLVYIVHMHSKCVVQKEFFSTKFTLRTNNLHIGIWIEKVTGDGVFYLNVFLHLTVRGSLKAAIAPLTDGWIFLQR